MNERVALKPAKTCAIPLRYAVPALPVFLSALLISAGRFAAARTYTTSKSINNFSHQDYPDGPALAMT